MTPPMRLSSAVGTPGMAIRADPVSRQVSVWSQPGLLLPTPQHGRATVDPFPRFLRDGITIYPVSRAWRAGDMQKPPPLDDLLAAVCEERVGRRQAVRPLGTAAKRSSDCPFSQPVRRFSCVVAGISAARSKTNFVCASGRRTDSGAIPAFKADMTPAASQ